MAEYKSSFILNDKVSPALKDIVANLRKMDRDLGRANKSLEIMQRKFENIGKLGKKIKDIGKGLTVGVTLPVIAMGGAMVKLATDMEETINKVDVSFGSSSDKVKEWAKNSITSMGLAKQSALDSAALYGDMATGMGMSQEKAAEMAMSLTQLGADLASFKNISNDVAQTALKSIFTGETESLKNLGVVMTEANLQNYALSRGYRKKIKDMTELQKIQLRYNYVLSRTTNAQGDFIRTGGGAANQTRMFQENLKELGATFGQYILPHFTKAMVGLNKMLVSFGKLSPGMQKFILIAGVVAAAIGPIVLIIGQFIIVAAALPKALLGIRIAMAGLSKSFIALKASMLSLLTNPITWWVVGITVVVVALVAGIVALVKNWDKVKAAAISAGQAISNWWGGLMNKLSTWISNLIGWLDGLIEKLGFIANFIPGLNTYKLAKGIAGAITNNRTTNNTSNVTNSNNTTTNHVTNNYMGPRISMSPAYST